MDMKHFDIINRTRCESKEGFNHPLILFREKQSSWSLSDWMVATFGELGEAANIVKKLNRERDGIVGNTDTEAELWAKLADELADTFVYLSLMSQAAGIDLGDAVLNKFDATSAKIGYPSLFKLAFPDDATVDPHTA